MPNLQDKIYKVTYNSMLYSDFEGQGWEKPELGFSVQEIAEFTGKDIDITQV